jgi:hypothetical protein
MARRSTAPDLPPAPATDAPARDAACPNCGAAAPGAYCAACGQAQADRVHVTLGALLHDVAGELASWDAKLPATLRRLVRHPGALTVDHLAGRRARHLPPLRLYLLASVVFFLAFSAAGRLEDAPAASEPPMTAADSAALRAELAAARQYADSMAGGGGVRAMLARRITNGATALAGRPRAERDAAVRDAITAHVPKAMFALVPAFAALLMLAYRSRRRYYAEHLVTALHLHAFAFLVLTLELLFDAEAWQSALLAWLGVYVFMALRRVYGGGTVGTLARLAAIATVYSVLQGLALATIVVASLLIA